MSWLRRLALTLSTVSIVSLVLAAVAVAAGGGLAPGSYTFTNVSADALIGVAKGGPPTAQGFSLYVNRGLNSFQPEEGNGEETVSRSTMVQLDMFSATGSTFGCFTIDPSNFKVSKNLQSASLHTTLTAANACPGLGAPVTGKSAMAPKAGSGGGLPLPITIDVRWTGVGVSTNSRDTSTLTCLKYSTQATSVNHASSSIASGTISALTGPFTSDVAGVINSDTHLEINGTPNPACFKV
jgi:hypothetical protein